MNELKETPQDQGKTISDVYVSDFNRIAKSVQERAILTGEEPSIGEMEAQVALRASVMKISSLRREITSMRSVIAWFLEEECWPDGTEPLTWVFEARLEDVTQLHSGMMRTAKEFTEISDQVAGTMIERVMEMNFPGSEEDAMRALSGMAPIRGHKERDKVTMQPITDREIMEIELHLTDHPHQNALKTLSRKRTDSRALLRIFMRVIRLTGMRPVEVFSSRLLVGRQGREYTPAEIDLVLRAPMVAFMQELLVPIETIDPTSWGGMAAAVRGLEEITGVPPVLLIEAAKTTNANPDLVRPYRAQVLVGIDSDDLEVVCLAAHLHHFGMDRKRMSNLITTMTRNLTAIAREILPRRVDKLNLYSFRHDFATRARRRFDLWEVAALMGHTAKASTYTYGKKRTRKKSGSGGWMPAPDTEFSEAIRDKWGMKAERPAPDPTPIEERSAPSPARDTAPPGVASPLSR